MTDAGSDCLRQAPKRRRLPSNSQPPVGQPHQSACVLLWGDEPPSETRDALAHPRTTWRHGARSGSCRSSTLAARHAPRRSFDLAGLGPAYLGPKSAEGRALARRILGGPRGSCGVVSAAPKHRFRHPRPRWTSCSTAPAGLPYPPNRSSAFRKLCRRTHGRRRLLREPTVPAQAPRPRSPLGSVRQPLTPSVPSTPGAEAPGSGDSDGSAIPARR